MMRKPSRASLAGLLLAALAVAAACSGDGSPPAPVHEDHEDAAARVARTLLTDWRDREMRIVDPLTFEPMSGFEAIELGHWAGHYVSPDGRLSLSLIGPTQQPVAYPHLLDLVNGRELFRLEEPAGNFYPVAWSPDSRRVYLGLDNELWVVDVGAREARLLASFDHPVGSFDFRAGRIDVSPDGDRVYIFAFNLADSQTFTTDGDPFLIALDAGDGSEIGRVTLAGVLNGWRTETVDGEERGMSYTPGLAMSPDGDRYYVAHPESEEVTVVDLEALQVERVATPSREQSLFERVLGLFVSDAEAKSMNWTAKTVVVPPDGRYLYIAETRSLDPPAEVAQEGRLSILEAHSMKIVDEQEGPTSIALTPDGRHVLAWGSSSRWMQTAENEWSYRDYAGYGIRIYNAATAELEEHVDPDGLYGDVTPTGDGRYAYVFDLVYSDGETTFPDCEMPCRVLHILDIEAGDFVAEHRFEGRSVDLLTAGYAAD